MADLGVTTLNKIYRSNPYYRLASYQPQIPAHLDARSQTGVELAILTISLLFMGFTTCIVAILIMLKVI